MTSEFPVHRNGFFNIQCSANIPIIITNVWDPKFYQGIMSTPSHIKYLTTTLSARFTSTHLSKVLGPVLRMKYASPCKVSKELTACA